MKFSVLNRFVLSVHNTDLSFELSFGLILQGIGEPPLLLATTVHKAIRSAVLAARKDAGLTDFVQLDCPLTPTKVLEACH
jgi:xanthine dehydrogenase molybdopterin-binding subunit B